MLRNKQEMHKIPHIELQEVTKNFSRNGQSTNIGPVTLDIKKGEFVAIVGHSGCGKTTILNLISGLTKTDTGSIRINGELVDSPQKNCGFVFQEFSLFPWRTVIENVEFGLELRGIDRDKRRIRAGECLELVKLGHVLNSYPKELSGGMKQRVAIARALAYESSILLMDEPFGSLDAQTRDDMQEDLLNIWSETQKTIIFVTHSVREAVFLASRIFLMKTPHNTITKIFNIPQPYPRGIDDKVSIETNELVYNIHVELRT